MSVVSSDTPAPEFSMQTLHLMSRYQLASVVVLALGSAIVWPVGAVGIIAGGGVMAANFWFLKFLVERIFSSEGTGPKTSYALLLGFKFFGAMGLLALLVLVFELHPMGIAIGMFSLFSGIAFGMLHHTRVKRSQAG